MALTGRYNFRRSLTGKLVLQVEYEAKSFWSYFTGKNSFRRRWRNARVMDLAAPELRALVDLRFRPRFVPSTTQDKIQGDSQGTAQDWPMASRRLDAVPPRSLQYMPDVDGESPLPH